ncbi:MAG: Ig-like domain-containing protein [Thermoplasmatota archaeon]
MVLLLTTGSILIHFEPHRGPVSASREQDDPGDTLPSRKISENDPNGGLWYDDLSDQTGTVLTDNVQRYGNEISMNRIGLMDDFESFRDGEDITSSEKWTKHGSSWAGTATAESTSPGGARSTRMARFYNSAATPNSILLGPKFDMTKGTFQVWASPSRIDHTDHTTTKVNFYGTHDDSPTVSDRMFNVGFNWNGFSYYNGAWNNINRGVHVYWWYRIVVTWDISIPTSTISLYDELGTMLGTTTITRFENSYNSIKRIGLVSGHMVNYTATTSYFDDPFVIDKVPEGEGIASTNLIPRPENGLWSDLRIDKEEPGNSHLNITILDQNAVPVQGVTYDGSAENLDIGFLNELDIGAMRILGTFTPDGYYSPVLKGWGVEWNTTDGWRDSFLTDRRVEASNFHLENLSLYVTTPSKVSNARTSESIRRPAGCYWNMFSVSAHVTYPSFLLFDILDADTGSKIKGFDNLTAGRHNISGIDPIVHDTLLIQARGMSFGGLETRIDQWSVDWIPNSPPSISDLITPESVLRNESVVLQIEAEDPNQAKADLDVGMDHQVDGSSEWSGNMLSGLQFNGTSGFWEVNFNPPITAMCGSYNFRVRVEDLFGLSTERVFRSAVEVRNNIPTRPEIVLSPSRPTTESEIVASIITPSKDVEGMMTFYSYRWYVNGNELMEYRGDDLWQGAQPSIPASVHKKGDAVRCDVFATDGEDLSDTFSISVTIDNAGPRRTSSFSGTFTMMEDAISIGELDLSMLLEDPDRDILEYSVEGDENITVSIDEEGIVTIIPGKDWNGEDMITITVSDGELFLKVNITIMVEPVNDAPEGQILSPEDSIEVDTGEEVTFTAEIWDVDSTDLEVIWSWGSSKEIRGEEVVHHWTEEGTYRVSARVTDGEKITVLGNITVVVVDPLKGMDLEGYARSYVADSGNVIFDIVDIEGTITDIRSQGFPHYDILSLSSRVVGSNLVVDLELAGKPPVPGELMDNVEAVYYVYFVKGAWTEPDFASGVMQPNVMDGILPGEDSIHRIGTYLSTGYLTYGLGEDDYGNPQLNGNNITWKVPLEVLINSGVTSGELELYGAVTFTEETSIKVTGCFDTVGYGSKEHVIREQPSLDDDDGNEDETPWLLIIMGISIFFIMVIVMMFIVLLVVIMRSRKKEEPVPEPAPAPEPQHFDGPAVVHTGELYEGVHPPNLMGSNPSGPQLPGAYPENIPAGMDVVMADPPVYRTDLMNEQAPDIEQYPAQQRGAVDEGIKKEADEVDPKSIKAPANPDGVQVQNQQSSTQPMD